MKRYTQLKPGSLKAKGNWPTFEQKLAYKKLQKTGRRGKRFQPGDKKVTALTSEKTVCEFCGLPGVLEPHHIVKRRHKATRHLAENILSVDRACHDWIEAHPAEFEEWMLANHPGRWERLQRIKNGLEAA